MTRSADYTIQGFIYQFNKTLLEILEATEDSEIAIEGIIEDIEVKSSLKTKAIQCKYHESKEKFTLSCIYKPVLQMMDHYYENQESNIEYRLFAYFPNEELGTTKILEEEEILEIFKSTDKSLKKYIDKLNGSVDINEFRKRFILEFGPPMDELVNTVQKSLIENGMPESDIDTLIYPNAIQMIADISIMHDPTMRIITKKDMLSKLTKIKKTAISRWTKELKTIDKLLKSRRLQLRENLSKNSRLRYFIISEHSIDNFKDVIVTFISEYLGKYHYKPVHDKTPIFCLDCSLETFNNIRLRLHKKGIKYNDGIVAEIFDRDKFLSGPVRAVIGKNNYYTEFQLRLLHFSEEALNILNHIKCEDCFIFMDNIPDKLDTEDINIEHIGLNDINKIRYVMGMVDTYE